MISSALKGLMASACFVVIVSGGVAARYQYKLSSCQSAAMEFNRTMLATPTDWSLAFKYNDCVHAGWISRDAWKGN